MAEADLIRKPVEATLVEHSCDECGKGVYRKATHVIPTHPTPQYEHKCSNPDCDSSAYFTVIYPVMEYRGKRFMLADGIRFNMRS